MYWLDRQDNTIVAYNYLKDQSTNLPVHSPVNFVIHQDTGYALSDTSTLITIFDLKTNTQSLTLDVGIIPRSMHMYKNVGYIVHKDATQITIIELTTQTMMGTLTTANTVLGMIFFGDKGYVVTRGNNFNEGRITVYDLTTNTQIETIDTLWLDGDAVVHKGKAYFKVSLEKQILVLDLSTHTFSSPIDLSLSPQTCVIHNDTLFALGFSDHIAVIDLRTHLCSESIHIPSMELHCFLGTRGERGYALSSNTSKSQNTEDTSKCVIICLRTNRLVSMVSYLLFGIIQLFDPEMIDLATDRFLYKEKPVIDSLTKNNILDLFVTLMPEVFVLGEIQQRLVPKETAFDTLPIYLFTDDLAPYLTVQDLLSLLANLQQPEKIMKSVPGEQRMMPRIYFFFLYTLIRGDKKAARQMLLNLVRLEDPIIAPLATYSFKKIKT